MSSKAASVYQLKVTLLDTKPLIWRRVLVDGGITLDHLHEVIQAALVAGRAGESTLEAGEEAQDVSRLLDQPFLPGRLTHQESSHLSIVTGIRAVLGG